MGVADGAEVLLTGGLHTHKHQFRLEGVGSNEVRGDRERDRK